MGWVKGAILGAFIGFMIYLILVLIGIFLPGCGGDWDVNLNRPAMCDFSFFLFFFFPAILPIVLIVFAIVGIIIAKIKEK
mgnify:CR=1 FL=1